MRGVFSMYDKKTKVFSDPHCYRTIEEARRSFGQAAQDEKTLINKHPDDFELYFVGTFNEENGYYQPLEMRELVCSGSDFLNIA